MALGDSAQLSALHTGPFSQSETASDNAVAQHPSLLSSSSPTSPTYHTAPAASLQNTSAVTPSDDTSGRTHPAFEIATRSPGDTTSQNQSSVLPNKPHPQLQPESHFDIPPEFDTVQPGQQAPPSPAPTPTFRYTSHSTFAQSQQPPQSDQLNLPVDNTGSYQSAQTGEASYAEKNQNLGPNEGSSYPNTPDRLNRAPPAASPDFATPQGSVQSSATPSDAEGTSSTPITPTSAQPA